MARPTDAEIAQMAVLWNAGKRAGEIAEIVGRTVGSVQGVAHRRPDLFRQRRFFWTDEAISELRRQMNYGRTYAEIAAMLGTTENAARVKAYKLGWTSYDRSGFIRSQRPGRKQTAANRAAASTRAHRQWLDETIRERLLAGIRKAAVDPKRLAKISTTRQRQRGFADPAPDHDYWTFLRAGYSVHAAAIASKLLPQTQATGGR